MSWKERGCQDNLLMRRDKAHSKHGKMGRGGRREAGRAARGKGRDRTVCEQREGQSRTRKTNATNRKTMTRRTMSKNGVNACIATLLDQREKSVPIAAR